jgi:release factor glutamine methyltransferase
LTYREALTATAGLLTEAKVPDPNVDAWYLLSYATGMNRSDFYLKEDETLTQEEGEHLQNALKERVQRVPLQYILGTQDFMDLTFSVNENVLIPRQDTETLAEEAVRFLPKDGALLDLCTGSGCIAITVKNRLQEAAVTASDISKPAIAMAKENAKQNGVQVEWVVSDLFTAIRGEYDVITCNPPYIRTEEILSLEPEVRDYEPGIALDGGEDGLDFYRRIIPEAGNFLKPGGILLFEIGCDQGKEVTELMGQAGFQEVRVIRDLAGKDRVVKGRKHV